MIINNKFLIKSIKNIVFFGYSEKIFELIEINKNLNLKSSVITTSDQANLIDSRIKKKYLIILIIISLILYLKILI